MSTNSLLHPSLSSCIGHVKIESGRLIERVCMLPGSRRQHDTSGGTELL